jgi:hypothetical protein
LSRFTGAPLEVALEVLLGFAVGGFPTGVVELPCVAPDCLREVVDPLEVVGPL